MATIKGSIGARPQPIRLKEGASQTFKAGDLVKFAAGYVVIGTAAVFHGIACADASGTTAASIDVELLSAETLYRMTSTDTLAQTHEGTKFNITFTVGAHTIACADSATDGHVVQLIDAIGSSGGDVWVRFLPSVIFTGTDLT